MTLQDFGSIGELIAAIATVATLAYLAAQIRQNTTSVRAATFRSYVESAASWLSSIYQDAELTEIWRRGREDLTSLGEAERARFSLVLLAHFRITENAYVQAQRGLVQETEFQGIRESFILLIDSPGTRAWWVENASRYSTPFRNFVEAELRKRAA